MRSLAKMDGDGFQAQETGGSKVLRQEEAGHGRGRRQPGLQGYSELKYSGRRGGGCRTQGPPDRNF